MSKKDSQVCEAWKAGEAATGSSSGTNGHRIWSYGHDVGYTAEDGRKVGIDCHYSHTTTTFAGRVCAVADEVRPCPWHPAGKGQFNRVTVDAEPEAKLSYRGW